MKIFTPIWGGAKHRILFEQALGVSLSWPKNNEAIKGAEWLIVTDSEEELKKIAEITQKIRPDSKVRGILEPGLTRAGDDSLGALQKALLRAIKICLEDKEPMLMATPDFIYGDGTISAFQEVTSIEPGACATIAHMRVTPEFLKEIQGEPPTNSKLLGRAFEYAHPAWSGSEAGKDPGMTFWGGISWKNLGPGLKSVTHYLPSPFYVNFTERDPYTLNQTIQGRPARFELWDHIWPSYLLEEGRLRFIGSSDAALMVEITDEGANIPPLTRPEDPKTGYFRNLLHNRIQGQFVSVFRGEP